MSVLCGSIPEWAEAYLGRGAALNGKGDRVGAMRDYNRALKLDARLYEAYNNRGALRHDLGDLEDSLSDLNQAVSIKI